MSYSILPLLLALTVAASPAAPEGADPEAVRLVQDAAGHFDRAGLVQVDVVTRTGRYRLRREAGVGVEIESTTVPHMLIRGESIWIRPAAGAPWMLQSEAPFTAREALDDLDRRSVPATADALRARLAAATAVRLADPVPDEVGCAARGVLIDEVGASPARPSQLELRMCADDGRPLGARMYRPWGPVPGPVEDATYVLSADGALPDPAAG
jgi:hypothetical protein